MITTDLGAVTAYAEAVEQGYEGTKEEFGILLANYAKTAEQVSADRQSVEKMKEEVATSATQVAKDKEQVEEAKKAVAADRESVAEDREAAEQAKADTESAAESAGNNAIYAKKTASEISQDKATVEELKTAIDQTALQISQDKTTVDTDKKAVSEYRTAAEEAKAEANTAKESATKSAEQVSTDKTAVAEDKQAVAADKQAVLDAKASIEQMKEAVDKSAEQVAEDKTAVATDKQAVAADKQASKKIKKEIEEAQKTFVVDETLSESGRAADAKATGDKIKETVDKLYNEKVLRATSKEEVDALFVEWWNYQYDATCIKSEMLERWFGTVLNDSRVHGEKQSLYSKSTSMIGELTDDSAGLVCIPSTESTAGTDPFAHLPQFWCLEVAAEKNADGSHEIYYVEHIDDTADVRSGEHLCWVLQKNTWKKEWKDDEYKYLKMKCTAEEGYNRWPEGTDRTGKVHEYIAHPKYYAGIGPDGKITCGTGLAPVNNTSHSIGVTKWRARGSQYSGASGSLIKFLDTMMRLKYGKKGNSGTITGCADFYKYYKATVTEESTQRIIIAKSDAANLYVGCSVSIGTSSYNSSIVSNKLITKIEDIEVDGTVYSAVYIDTGGTKYNVAADSTYISVMPYYSGWNDNVLGRDGSRYNPKSGKETGMIQGIEFMNGSYLIVSDELWQWSTDADGNYNFDCFKCRDQSKVGIAINENYEKIAGAHLVFPAGTGNAWKYIGDNIVSDDTLWPETTDASGSGVGVGSGFYCYPSASAVRAARCFGSLDHGGNAGLACRDSGYGVGSGVWSGSLGAPGLEG